MITPDYYTIGEFAALGKITTRMLRHYDKINLLNPAQILQNGYRAYTSAQIVLMAKIRQYQNCQFSLAEIRTLLHSNEEQIQHYAKTKLKELQKQEPLQYSAREQLELLAGHSPRSFENVYEISFTHQSKQLLFCCYPSISLQQVETAINQLYQTLQASKISPNGLLLLLSDLRDGENYRVAVPVKSEIAQSAYQCIMLDSGWYLSTFHYGDYYTLGSGYDALIRYAREQGYELENPFMERYFVDAGKAASPAEYITQILVKIIA